MSLMENAQLIGRYYSVDWARKNVLQQTEDEIEEQDEMIEEEGSAPDMMQPPDQMEPGGPPQAGGPQKPLSGDEAAVPSGDDKVAKVRRAKVEYKMLMKKENKSLQDQAKLKSLSQIVAKNKGIV